MTLSKQNTVLAMCALVAGTFTIVGACGARTELEVHKSAKGGAGGGPPDCVVFNSSADLAPLDLFVMLDASGSMLDDTASGQTKWLAVRDAFSTFVHDSESNGIGVAVAFFPIIDLSVTKECYEEAACGAPGYCQFINVCPSSGTICLDQSDCAAAGFPNDPCAYYGQCAMGGGASACIPDAGINCPPGAGPCVPIGFCENRFTCDPEPYGPPVFGVELLPAAADEFVQTINKQIPDGGTPTLPALTGVIEHATAWSAANPTHNVIVVLATDGQPSVCDPDLLGDPAQAIANLAAVAGSGNQAGIQTWVIGVFSPAAQAQAQLNLDAIAEAGGTEKAFVIATNDVVTSEFLAALNQVRLTAKSCEFELSLGEDVDYDEVWVKITPKGAEPIWVKRVPSADACVEGGFFYDDPFAPTKIVLCPETCAVLGASPDRTLEIFTTCPDPTGDG